MSLATVTVATEPPYPVRIGPAALEALPNAVASADRVALLADERVLDLHGASLAALGEVPTLAIGGGEDAKTLGKLGAVLEFLAAAGLARSSTLITFGGGTLADLGGLAASLFKRGMQVVHAPTTLLAQVDASVGGKTAINLSAGKNLAGTFHQPAEVLCDTSTLATLPAAERASGLGEVVKTALIGGEADLALLEAQADGLLAGDAAALAATVTSCVTVKARVVACDPTERGPRRGLNLGHTFAHAIEHVAGYGAVPHGVAVAAGIGLALRASAELGLLTDPALEARIRALLERLGLPADLSALRQSSGLALPVDELMAGFAHDKKGAVGRPEFVLVSGAGALELGVTLEVDLLQSLLA
ncbi:MAG: 3-dehydroquinate synthase [Planctomycetota bacterium]|nr:3-dehydroquinate synthase [Planctomycetota bacterium]